MTNSSAACGNKHKFADWCLYSWHEHLDAWLVTLLPQNTLTAELVPLLCTSMQRQTPYSYQIFPFVPTADIGSTLALLAGKVQTPTHPPTGMGHDPQPRLQNGCHHCNVGAVPQQPPVAQLAVPGKSSGFGLTVYPPHIQQLWAGPSSLKHKYVMRLL